MKIFGIDLFPLNSVIAEPLTSTRHDARQWGCTDKFGNFARNQTNLVFSVTTNVPDYSFRT